MKRFLVQIFDGAFVVLCLRPLEALQYQSESYSMSRPNLRDQFASADKVLKKERMLELQETLMLAFVMLSNTLKPACLPDESISATCSETYQSRREREN